jgi:hypothetical protein
MRTRGALSVSVFVQALSRARFRCVLGAFARTVFACVVALVVLTDAAAAAPPPPRASADPPPLANDLAALVAWLGARGPAPCTERCYVLTELALSGSAAEGVLQFVLQGNALADPPVVVPLFGPPDRVRLDGVTANGSPAAVGFETNAYYAVLPKGAFVLRGTLTLDAERALRIPGPLNALTANLANGRVVEGQKLSGLKDTTIHFDSGEGAKPDAEPPVFQLSRAFRVARETAFEYRLVLRSGSDLGVVRVPLAYGEKVVDVAGSNGFRVEGNELVLSTSGRSASITITGTVAELPRRLTPDPRSAYEWWLLESDGEHRILATDEASSAKQVDSAESPLARTQPTGRLFLAKRGEGLALSVQTLTSTEALGAVVRTQNRRAVLTSQGDWVIDEQLTYENNGVDHLLFSPAGRPIFLATDSVAERLMRKEGDASQLVVPLRRGVHTARVQSLGETRIAPLFGVLAVPVADHPLTASQATVDVGLPEVVHPIAVFGGEKAQWLVGMQHAFAIVVAVIVSFWLARTRRDRVLAVIATTGLWFVSPSLFVLFLAALSAFVLARLTARLAPTPRMFGRLFAAGAVIVVAFGALIATRTADRPSYAPPRDTGVVPSALEARSPSEGDEDGEEVGAGNRGGDPMPWDRGGRKGLTGNFAAQRAEGGVLAGVAPVALPMPSATHRVFSNRELVTRDRPFSPRIVYVTSYALVPFAALWALALLALAWLHKAELARLRARLGELLAPVTPRTEAIPVATPPTPEPAAPAS